MPARYPDTESLLPAQLISGDFTITAAGEINHLLESI
jgi:hypothetical protein